MATENSDHRNLFLSQILDTTCEGCINGKRETCSKIESMCISSHSHPGVSLLVTSLQDCPRMAMGEILDGEGRLSSDFCGVKIDTWIFAIQPTNLDFCIVGYHQDTKYFFLRMDTNDTEMYFGWLSGILSLY